MNEKLPQNLDSNQEQQIPEQLRSFHEEMEMYVRIHKNFEDFREGRWHGVNINADDFNNMLAEVEPDLTGRFARCMEEMPSLSDEGVAKFNKMIEEGKLSELMGLLVANANQMLYIDTNEVPQDIRNLSYDVIGDLRKIVDVQIPNSGKAIFKYVDKSGEMAIRTWNVESQKADPDYSAWDESVEAFSNEHQESVRNEKEKKKDTIEPVVLELRDSLRARGFTVTPMQDFNKLKVNHLIIEVMGFVNGVPRIKMTHEDHPLSQVTYDGEVKENLDQIIESIRL